MDKYFSKQDQVPKVYRNISSVPGPIEFSIDWNKGVVATSTSTTYIQVNRHVGPPLLEQKRTHVHEVCSAACSLQHSSPGGNALYFWNQREAKHTV